jgi:hypothetical protein
MDNGSHKNTKNKRTTRKSGRATFDKSGRSVWEWQTSTGVFETHITEEQLAELEAAQLTILDAPKPQNAVSYWEWQERSRSNPPSSQTKHADGAIKRLVKRLGMRVR